MCSNDSNSSSGNQMMTSRSLVFTAWRCASAVLVIGLYLRLSVCVCLSHFTSRSSMETVKWIQLIFLAWRFPSTYPSLCYKGNSGNSKNNNKNRPTSPRNFVPNFGLRNFRHGNSTVLPTNFVDGRAYILIAQKNRAHTQTRTNRKGMTVEMTTYRQQGLHAGWAKNCTPNSWPVKIWQNYGYEFGV